MIFILLALESKSAKNYWVLGTIHCFQQTSVNETEAIKAVHNFSYLQLPSEQSHKNTEIQSSYFLCSYIENLLKCKEHKKHQWSSWECFCLTTVEQLDWMLRVNLDSQAITRNKVIFLFLPGLDILPYWMEGREGKGKREKKNEPNCL